MKYITFDRARLAAEVTSSGSSASGSGATITDSGYTNGYTIPGTGSQMTNHGGSGYQRYPLTSTGSFLISSNGHFVRVFINPDVHKIRLQIDATTVIELEYDTDFWQELDLFFFYTNHFAVGEKTISAYFIASPVYTSESSTHMIDEYLANHYGPLVSRCAFAVTFTDDNEMDIEPEDYPDWTEEMESEEGGGEEAVEQGDAFWDMNSDTIDDPTEETLPDIALGSGFNALYKVSNSAMSDLASWLWSTGLSDIYNKWKNGDPMNSIVDYYALPFAVSVSSVASHIVCGSCDSEVGAYKVLGQYQKIDCGAISLLECFGSYLDYAPLTKLSIFLPYIGIRNIDTDEVMGCSGISVKYMVDVTNGDFCAIVYLTKPAGRNNNDNGFSYPAYHFAGNMAYHIPWSGAARNAFMTGVLGMAPAAAGVGIGIAAGAAAPVVGGLVAAGAMAATLNKPTVQKGGSLSGSTGWMDNQKPFLIIDRPVQNRPATFAHDCGYILDVSKQVKDCSGFTKYSKIHVEGIGCTSEENELIHQALMKGIIV